MRYTIIQEFEGKRVEVYTTKNSFTGTLKYDLHGQVLIITPTDTYDQRRRVQTVINQDQVVAISELKDIVRNLDKKSWDADDGDDCEKDESAG